MEISALTCKRDGRPLSANPNGGTCACVSIDACPLDPLIIPELPIDLEWAAANLWRQENPDKSVFACDVYEKSRYRARVLRGER